MFISKLFKQKLIIFSFSTLLEKTNNENENLFTEIEELKKAKAELETRIQQQNLDVEEMKRSHQQALAENSDTIRNLKVSVFFFKYKVL